MSEKVAKVCTYLYILVILLSLACLLQPAHCIVEESDPEGGSTLTGNEGEENITIFCSVLLEAGGEQRITEWFIEREQTSGPTLIFDTAEFANFVIVGEPVPNTTDLNYRTNFTILRLTSDLDRAVIFCGRGGNPPVLANNFTLRIYRPPDLNNILERTATENDRAEIDVGIGVEPFPFPQQFQWKKDGVAVINSSRISYGYPTVVFQSVRREDEGNYTLSATNFRLDDENQQVGSDTGSFVLNVFFGPDITLGPSVVATLEGDNATFICGTNLTGNPEPTVEWMDNSNTEVRRNDSRFFFDDSPEIVSLGISNVSVEDDGVWRCNVRVENASEVQQNVTLIVVVAPSEPRNVSVDSTGGTWAVISWQMPEFIGRPPFTKYRISATSLLNANTSTAVVLNETDTLTVNVTGLLPATEYEFTVVAVSEVQAAELFIAESPQSVADIGTTALTVPEPVCSDAPTSEGGVITVMWSYAHTGGLNLTGVAVDYRASNEAANFLQLENGNLTDLGQTLLEVLNFTAGRTYTFRVTVTNERGSTTVVCPSVLHAIGIPQTPATPTGMSNSPGNVTLTLSTAESGTETSTEFFKFTVRAERVANGDVSLHLRVIEDYTDAQAVEVAIGGLVGDEMYRFSARASNSFGSSSFSENSQAIRVLEFPVMQPANVGGIVAGVIVAIVVIVLIIIIILLIVYCCVIKPSKAEKSAHYGEELVSNQLYVTHGKADPQTKQTEFQLYEAIDDSKKEVSASNDSLYDSLAPHPQPTDNPLYSSMGGLEVEIQMQQDPPATPAKHKLPEDQETSLHTGSPSEDHPKNEPMYSEAVANDHPKSEPVYSEAIPEPSEKQHSPQPQATEHVYMDPGPPVVVPTTENVENGNSATLDDGSEGTAL